MGLVARTPTFTASKSDVAGGTALAVYRLTDGVMTFTHTKVPAALRGRGLGSQMMHGVLQNVRAQGLKSCCAVPLSPTSSTRILPSTPIVCA